MEGKQNLYVVGVNRPQVAIVSFKHKHFKFTPSLRSLKDLPVTSQEKSSPNWPAGTNVESYHKINYMRHQNGLIEVD
jgi:hypothetical protein